MWADEAVFYQIYPLGFTGAPMPNDGVCVNRIQKVKGWIPHLKKLHIGAVYFSPVFESDNHGYDTRDFTKIDCRLGTNEDFKAVCDALHENGIKVVLDGAAARSFRMSSGTGRHRRTGIGSTSISAATPATGTVFGTRAGRDITSLSSSISIIPPLSSTF